MLGRGRMALGAALLLAPATSTRRGLKTGEPSADAVTAWRVAGGRDLAIGLGTLLAARRASPALAGWLSAGALADAIDVYALGRDRSLRPLLRAGAALAAAAGAGGGTWAARRLAD